MNSTNILTAPSGSALRLDEYNHAIHLVGWNIITLYIYIYTFLYFFNVLVYIYLYIYKHIKKIFLNFKKCREDLITGEKSMETRVRMEHVQEWPHVQLSTSHTHINIPKCGVFSDCIWNTITTTLTSLSQNTICRDVYACVCDLWTVGHEVILEQVPFLPFPHTFFTSESVIPTFLEIKKKFCACWFTFFDGLWPLEMIRFCYHQHQHSFLHLCSFVCLVFYFRHTPKSGEECWKATGWSTSSVSEPESLRRLDSLLLSLIYKSEVYYFIL